MQIALATVRNLNHSADSSPDRRFAMRGKPGHLKLVENNRFVDSALRRLPNAAYRTREHLTPTEMDKLLAALKANRHGDRDELLGRMVYTHGLRVSEACDL